MIYFNKLNALLPKLAGYWLLRTGATGRPESADGDSELVIDFTGPQGPGGTAAVGTTDTVASNQPAEVTGSGTPQALVLNFKIPRGRSIVNLERTDGTGAAGTTDTYTITFDDVSSGEWREWRERGNH